MTGLKKQRNKNHWTLPYVGAAQRYAVDIWLVEDKSSAYFGKYHVICGAASEMADTLEEAARLALWFTHGGAL
jgi:recombinational DNA repair protein RecR